jgi:hypothetical protein
MTFQKIVLMHSLAARYPTAGLENAELTWYQLATRKRGAMTSGIPLVNT